MLARVPVLAANEGGPTETVVDGETGWLRSVDQVEEWTQVMNDILTDTIDSAQRKRMGEIGRARVQDMFSKDTMARRLDEEVERLKTVSRRPIVSWTAIISYTGERVPDRIFVLVTCTTSESL